VPWVGAGAWRLENGFHVGPGRPPPAATFPSMSDPRPPAVLLLSGGLDSTTLLALAVRDGYAVHALSFRYGQRHAHELEAAQRVAAMYGAVEHRIADIDLRLFGGSALTSDLPVPKDRPAASLAGSGVPVTYVPARNTIFLAFALAYAEVVGATELFIGVNALDYSGYPDCRPAFLEAFERMANLATAAATEHGRRLRVRAPLVDLSKAAIVRLGLELGVDYGLTTSCYDPDPAGRACGHCDACQLRLKGFAEAGARDPAAYV
jgi:7-cyano-7-deazaguanine synthase